MENSEDETFRLSKRELDFEVVFEKVFSARDKATDECLESLGWTRDEYQKQSQKHMDEHFAKLNQQSSKWSTLSWDIWWHFRLFYKGVWGEIRKRLTLSQ